MQRLRYISFVVILASLLLLVSCGKSVQTKIIGKWELQYFDDKPHEKIIWEFNAEGKIKKTIGESKSYVGTYTTKTRFAEGSYIDISGLDKEYGTGMLANDDGKYFVHKLTSDQLVIERVEAYGRTEGVYKWYEFIRTNQ